MAINVKGMTIEEIRALNTRSLSLSDLQAVTTRLVSAANKRVRRMEADKFGQASPVATASRKAASEGRKLFETKGLGPKSNDKEEIKKARARIKAEFDRVRAFLDPSKKTHTVRGWRNTVKETAKKTGVSLDILTDPEFWKMYRRLENDEAAGGYTSTTLIPIMADGYKEKGIRDDEDMRALLRGEYENREAKDQQEESIFGPATGEFENYHD